MDFEIMRFTDRSYRFGDPMEFTDLDYDSWQDTLQNMGFDPSIHILEIETRSEGAADWQLLPSGRGGRDAWIRAITDAATYGLVSWTFNFRISWAATTAQPFATRKTKQKEKWGWDGDENGDFMDNEAAGEENEIIGQGNLINRWQESPCHTTSSFANIPQGR